MGVTRLDPASSTLRPLALCAALLVLGLGSAVANPPQRIDRSPPAAPVSGPHDAFVGALDCGSCHEEPGAPAQEASSAGVRPPLSLLGSRGGSLQCLSCHDGTTAPDSLPARPDQGGIGGGHPVSVRYDSDTVRGSRTLRDPSLAPSGLGGTLAQDLLVEGRVECTSCHDFHGNGRRKLLRMSNARSKLCLTCHDM